MEPSWQPDPTGRHHYRWWDGVHWSDQVSDHGDVATDPFVAAVPPPPPPPPPPPEPVLPVPPAAAGAPYAPAAAYPTAPTAPGGSFAPPASVPGPVGPVPSEDASKRGKLVVAAIAAAVVIVGALLVFGRGGGSPSQFGVTEAKLAENGSFVTKKVRLKAGEVVRIRLEPARRLDVAATVLVDEKAARAAADLVASDLPDIFSEDDPDKVYDDAFTDAASVITDGDAEGKFDGQLLYESIDHGSKGDTEADFLVAFADATYTIVVTSSASESHGDVRIVLEKYDKVFDPKHDDLTAFLDGRFFSDSDFFSDSGPFTPDS